MAGRAAIKSKSDISEIVRKTATKLGVKDSEVKKEINFYWLDIDSMLNNSCGYGAYVPNFGHFLMYISGIRKQAQEYEDQIKKYMRYLSYCQSQAAKQKEVFISQQIADVLTRVILLDYSVELYKNEVLQTYPRKYKVVNYSRYQAVLKRLEKLFRISLHEFPITVNHPVQALFVRSLRKKGVLRNPVVWNIKLRRVSGKNKNLSEDKEV